MEPLKQGRRSIQDQAGTRGEATPIGATVQQMRDSGYDTDPDWDDSWILKECSESPTGHAVGPRFVFSENTAIYALAV